MLDEWGMGINFHPFIHGWQLLEKRHPLIIISIFKILKNQYIRKKDPELSVKNKNREGPDPCHVRASPKLTQLNLVVYPM